MTKRRNPRAKSHPVPAPPAAVAEDSASIQPPDQPTAEVTHRQEFRVHQSVVVSPIPPPEHLAAYQAIQGDIPERLLQQMEKQAEHRRSLESRALSGRARLEILGLCLGFVVVITVVGGGLYLMATGQAWVGGNRVVRFPGRCRPAVRLAAETSGRNQERAPALCARRALAVVMAGWLPNRDSLRPPTAR